MSTNLSCATAKFRRCFSIPAGTILGYKYGDNTCLKVYSAGHTEKQRRKENLKEVAESLSAAYFTRTDLTGVLTHLLKTGPGPANLMKLNCLFMGFSSGQGAVVLVWMVGFFFPIRHYLELGEQRTHLHVANTGSSAGKKKTRGKKPQQEAFTNIYAEV